VYLHKAVISAEQMLIKILYRARVLAAQGCKLFATTALEHFLTNNINHHNFLADVQHLQWFTRLDDTDIMSALKEWVYAEDKILKTLWRKLMNRDLMRTELRNTPFLENEISSVRQKVKAHFGLEDDEVDYFVYTQVIQNSAYDIQHNNIKIINNRGHVQDITEASDLSNIEALAKRVVKFAISYPKEIGHPLDGVNNFSQNN